MAQNTSSSGIGLGGVLFIVFLVLKLTGTIAWSWWWVTAPLWGGLALALGVTLLALPFVALFAWLWGRKHKAVRKSLQDRLEASMKRFDDIR